MVDRRGDQGAVGAPLQAGAQIVFAQVIGGDIASQQRGLADVVDGGSTGQRATSSTLPATARTSSTGRATASGSRGTRSRTW